MTSLHKLVASSTYSIVAMLSLIPAVHAQEAIRGRIHDAHDGNIHVCFYHHFMPIEGEELVVMRHVVVAAPKFETTIRMENVGLVRITKMSGDSCADATLSHGSAHPFVWLAATAKP